MHACLNSWCMSRQGIKSTSRDKTKWVRTFFRAILRSLLMGYGSLPWPRNKWRSTNRERRGNHGLPSLNCSNSVLRSCWVRIKTTAETGARHIFTSSKNVARRSTVNCTAIVTLLWSVSCKEVNVKTVVGNKYKVCFMYEWYSSTNFQFL